MTIVGKWSLNGNSNAQVGINGTDTAITYVDGKMNGAASFNGSTSLISIPDSTSLDITNTITMRGFVKINSAVNYAGLFYKGTNTGGVLNYSIDLGANGITPRFSFTSPSNTYKVYQSNMTLTVGEWYRIIATHTFGNGANTKIYINGENKGGSWTFGTGNESAVVNNENLYLGRINGTTISLNGLLDEMVVENTIITDAEAKNEYLYYNGFI